jgi:hypothetical protein
VLIVGLCFLIVRSAYPFLAVNDPVESRLLVVEGWLPDHALEVVSREFGSGRYDLIATTGEELLVGSYLSPFRSFAGLAAETLKRLGVPSTMVVAVPASRVKRDRTVASAIALKRWLGQSGSNHRALNLATLGAHARRSRSVFQEVLGDSVQVGVIAIPDEGFDPDRWWRTSRGVNTMMDESVGYLYWMLLGSVDGSEDPE